MNSYCDLKKFLDGNYENCLILHGGSGVGKTFLLHKVISEYEPTCIVKYVDCRALLQKRRGTIEEYLLNLCGNELVSDEPCRESKQYIVLLDNIDDVSGSMVRSRSLVECSISSAVITVVDRVILSGRGKCVLTSTCPPNQLHERLMQPCRISTSIFLDYPSFELRQTSVLAALLESNCTLLLDDDCSPPCEQMVSNSTHGMQEWAVAILTKLSESVARRTQGCTITDVANVVRNAMLYAEPMSSRVDRRVMSRSDIRSGVVVMCQHGSESMFTGIRKKLSSSNGDDRTVCLSLSVIARSLDLLSKPIVDVGMLGSGSTADGASVANLTFVDAFGALPGVSGVTEGVPLVGMEDIQQKLKRTVLGPYCSETKQFFQRLGIRPCSGVVIQSPPGCGKTALSNWLVREGREHFKCISVSCAELVDKVVGASEQKLSNIFAVARLHAPCFLLLENIDCILGKAANDDDFPGGDGGGGSKRSLQRTSHHALDRILSTMLVELDGIQKSSDREMASALDFAGADAVSANIVAGKDSSVVVIATTSDMSLLDGALLRPGRLEEHVFIKAPTAAMRKTILLNKLQFLTSRQSLLPNVRIFVDPSCDVVSAELSKDRYSKGMSPAQLLQIITEGWISAVRQHIKGLHGQTGGFSEEITLHITSSTFEFFNTRTI